MGDRLQRPCAAGKTIAAVYAIARKTAGALKQVNDVTRAAENFTRVCNNGVDRDH